MTPPNTPAPGEAAATAGPRLLAWRELSVAQREDARRQFLASVHPALTPLAVGPGHPFPRLRDTAVHLAVSLARRERRRRGGLLLAVVQVPPALPRLLRLAGEAGGEGDAAFALLEEVVAACAGELFPGHAVEETAAFRVRGREVELVAGASKPLEAALAAALKVGAAGVRRVPGPLEAAELLAPGDGRRPALRAEPVASPGPAGVAA